MLPFLPIIAAVGLAVVGSSASERRKKRAQTGDRSPRTPHNIAEGTQVPAFGRARAGARRRAGVECPPLPWLGDDVNFVVEDAIVNKGVRDERAVTLMALHEVYRMTEDGRPLQWPTVPEDCTALKMLEERTRARVRHYLAEISDLEAEALYKEMT